MAKYTPMMEQYLGIKEQYKDCILMYLPAVIAGRKKEPQCAVFRIMR
jgi:hypothetical protein